MNDVLNSAARRMLQVVMDMLQAPDYEEQLAEWKAKPEGSRYGLPCRFRCDTVSVEAAFRTAEQAHKLLLDCAIDGEVQQPDAKPRTAP